MSLSISMLISALALILSAGSAVMSLRADRRARESVRPYVTTGVHILPDDMCVSLSNYGAGVAIITKISMSRGDTQPKNSLVSLLPGSSNYEVQGAISFVQEQYYLRPGDSLPMATANTRAKRKTEDALRIGPMG